MPLKNILKLEYDKKLHPTVNTEESEQKEEGPSFDAIMRLKGQAEGSLFKKHYKVRRHDSRILRLVQYEEEIKKDMKSEATKLQLGAQTSTQNNLVENYHDGDVILKVFPPNVCAF